MSPRIKPSFQHDSKNWTFSGMWLKELNLLNTTQRIEPFFKKKRTQRIEPFWNVTQRIEPFFPNVTHRIEPLFMTQGIEPFFFLKTTQNTTQRTEPFFNMTQRFCLIRLKESNTFFFEYDSKIRTSKKKNSKNWTFWTWLKELNLLKYDSKNWF